MQPIQVHNKVMQQSFHFIQPQEVMRNAVIFSRRRAAEAAQDKQARSLVKPRLLDRAVLYIQAVI